MKEEKEKKCKMRGKLVRKGFVKLERHVKEYRVEKGSGGEVIGLSKWTEEEEIK